MPKFESVTEEYVVTSGYPAEVFEEYETVRSDELAPNMFDFNSVQRRAFELDCHVLVTEMGKMGRRKWGHFLMVVMDGYYAALKEDEHQKKEREKLGLQEDSDG